MAPNAPLLTPPDQADTDAFTVASRKLDALLDARKQRERALHNLHDPEAEGSGFDNHDQAVTPVAPDELVDAPSPRPSATPQPAEANAKVVDEILSLLDQQDETEPPPATPDPTDTDASAALGSQAAPVAAPPVESPGLNIPNNPSSADLDAELEALLAESPIDPEVLNAADEIAKRDSEQAEQNKEALRQRAEQASEALALQAKKDVTATPETGNPDGAVHDEIMDEINDLLTAEEESAQHESDLSTDTPAQDPTIDQIDQMLAEGADDDEDEISGAFYSAEDVATDNLTGSGETLHDDDELPGTFEDSSDVADDEADPETKPETEKNGLALRDKLTRYGKPALRLTGRLALRLCWLINLPARKFLTTQWRATLGYIALLQAVGALVVWLYLAVL
ncbi:MAG: hypothetical protein AAGA29_00315 [Planctomycetota bacterium]